MPVALPLAWLTFVGTRFDRKFIFSYRAGSNSSSLALISSNPLLKTSDTLSAPRRSADRAQSTAVSPIPNTTTWPWSLYIFYLAFVNFVLIQTFGRKVFELNTLGNMYMSLPSCCLGLSRPVPIKMTSYPSFFRLSSVMSLPNSRL